MIYRLRYGRQGRELARVEADAQYSGMWRIHWPDGVVSDMVNLSRAKDAAMGGCRRVHSDLPHDGRLHWDLDPGQERRDGPRSDFGVSGDTNRMEESRLEDLAQDRNGFGRLVDNG